MTTKQFTDIYLTFGGLLYKVAFYLLESRADAEDAVQDLYIRLWNSRILSKMSAIPNHIA